jgi:hypothetical protein
VTVPDADLATMNDGELFAVIRSASVVLRQADAMRLRQARAMRILQHDRKAKRAAIAEAAGMTESAVRQKIKGLQEAEPLAG